MTREPSDSAVLSARLAKAFPALSAYSCATLAEQLCSIERAQRRHEERCCNGDYIRTDDQLKLVDGQTEERAGKRIERRAEAWQRRIIDHHRDRDLAMPFVSDITLQHDPRGPVLLIQLPGETEANTV